jgi:hypothetical protein
LERPHRSRRAAKTILAAAGVTCLPLNLVVIEHDVEVAGGNIASIDQNQLECV